MEPPSVPRGNIYRLSTADEPERLGQRLLTRAKKYKIGFFILFRHLDVKYYNFPSMILDHLGVAGRRKYLIRDLGINSELRQEG